MENNLQNIRHSLAHLLAAAVLELYPNTKLTIGPAIDNGFYYDFDFETAISEKELSKIEKKMKSILKHWNKFTHEEVSETKAKEVYEKNPYKLELIEEISHKSAGENRITLYTCGKFTPHLSIDDLSKNINPANSLNIYSKAAGFTDLCRGGHVDNPAKDIDSEAFKLDRIAGAYWRGDEKNKMLTRIYGLAFETKGELDTYIAQQEEGKRRDHRILGEQLDIFTFDEDVGPGLPLWLPNGAIIVEELENLAKKTEADAGYVRVRTPHIAKESMYLKSGHLPYYEDGMYPPMEYEGSKYYLKAMNCPHHHKIFAARPRSYRELPLRMAEYGTVYRHEKSGELFGLMRVRMLEMNDAHIYCTEEQFFDEFQKVNEMYLHYFKIFGINKYLMRFSTHDPKKLGEKYVNEPALWKKTEDMVRDVLIKAKIPYVEVPNEAAFYGPKIDVQVWSAIGREFTLATNQVDFAVPRKFDLTFTNAKGEAQTPLCIHRAPLGTHERFIGFLIEHYAGAFPLWLSPVQVAIVPVSEKFIGYANEVYKKMKDAGIRVELNEANESLGKRIREAETRKTPYILIIGEKEVSDETLSVRARGGKDEGAIKVDNFIAKIREEIKSRK